MIGQNLFQNRTKINLPGEYGSIHHPSSSMILISAHPPDGSRREDIPVADFEDAGS
jgi:hypothetical protein